MAARATACFSWSWVSAVLMGMDYLRVGDGGQPLAAAIRGGPRKRRDGRYFNGSRGPRDAAAAAQRENCAKTTLGGGACCLLAASPRFLASAAAKCAKMQHRHRPQEHP